MGPSESHLSCCSHPVLGASPHSNLGHCKPTVGLVFCTVQRSQRHSSQSKKAWQCKRRSDIIKRVLQLYYRSDITQNVLQRVTQLCPTLCNPMNRSTPGLPLHHPLPEFTQTHAHRVSDAIQPSHPLSSPSPPAPNPSQHQSLFQ